MEAIHAPAVIEILREAATEVIHIAEDIEAEGRRQEQDDSDPVLAGPETWQVRGSYQSRSRRRGRPCRA